MRNDAHYPLLPENWSTIRGAAISGKPQAARIAKRLLQLEVQTCAGF
jgi:hypothetical protein